jgi:translation initiation factor 1
LKWSMKVEKFGFSDEIDVQVGETCILGAFFRVICSQPMTSARKSRTVYSTDKGRLCPKCGWPLKNCRCASQMEQAVPDRITARLRIERARRKGKTVTIIESLPRNRAYLKQLAGELKRVCGSGGSAGEAHIEIQGDHRDTLRAVLRAKGWVVKG